jgi:uncharacterized membrane protein YhaH (DUF805 family)
MAANSTPLMFQPLVKYVDFNGRARRSEYWLFFLFQILVSLALTVIGSFGSLKDPVDAISGLFSLAMLIPNISVGVRRFHDINRTGWWTIFQLVVLIVTFILYFIVNGAAFVASISEIDWQAIEAGDGTAAVDMFRRLTPLFLWVFLPWWIASLVTFVFHVLDGTKGPNRFGPDPKGPSADASVF